MTILETRVNNTAISNTNMGTPSFHEFKKQASFFLKEKIKTARLALTDVTPAQLLTEEATNENHWSPDTRTMSLISRAAFEVDDYWRIVDILHKRLSIFDGKNWRISYNTLIILEHLLTHGPESTAEEFQTDKDIIRVMESFQYIDERGFNWGLTVRNKSERLLRLLEKGPLLKEERNRARKISRGIEGFGSFSHRFSSTVATSFRDSSLKIYERSHSDFTDEGQSEIRKEQLEEKKTPTEELIPELHELDWKQDSKPLLDDQKDEVKVGFSFDEDHPFINSGLQTTNSLISTGNEILQGG